MKKLWEYKRLIFTSLILVLLIIIASKIEIETKGMEKSAPQPVDTAINKQEFPQDFPSESDFNTVAETEILTLKFESKFGHFQVLDKRNNHVYYSYPDPKNWENETISGLWRNHLRSPLMIQYVDFSDPSLQLSETNLITDGGSVLDLKPIEDGVEFKLVMPDKGFVVPVRIRIEDDFVETTVIDSGVTEQDLSIIWMRLYPFFGAEHTTGQDGYLFIPDGSGAIINFTENSQNTNKVYHESVYGSDISFDYNGTGRQSANAPVFGMKSSNKAFLAVMLEGEEYMEVYGSPGGVFSKYNWITGQMRYRKSFFQTTNESKGLGFTTYNRQEPFKSESDRSIRYYVLDEEHTDYVGMATRYRQHLMDYQGLQRVENADSTLPLHVTLVGGLVERGVINERFVTATSTSEAMQIIQKLYGMGIEKMSITYQGWQKDGYGSYGGLFPVNKHIGGTDGMKQFIQFAHSLNFPVYLEANYMYNNTGSDGFVRRYHGLRDLGGSLLSWGNIFNSFSIVSHQFLEKTVMDDLDQYEELDADGIYFGALGRFLNTDYNTQFGASREKAKQIHTRILASVKERLGSVQGKEVNSYAFENLDHINRIADDYSFDLFSDHRIPFLQISLHGLISYSTQYANDREQYNSNFLRDIEYGALPSFIFTKASEKEVMNAYEFYYNSPTFDKWKDHAVQEYQRFNEAIGDVQDLFIVGHRILADGVNETTYENGKRIIVNYNDSSRKVEGVTIPALDFVTLEGGEQQ